MIRYINLHCGPALAAAMAVAADSAYAQEPAVAPAAIKAAATSSGLEEIVVTAQRRSERLQDVPISVSVETADSLAKKGIENLTSLGSSIAGLQTQTNAVNSVIYLRGVGANSGDPNIESSVAIYVDGVYIATPNTTALNFSNIERVEVLKGPQGTLFGRNATGGVIQIVTKDPSHETGGQVSVGYGNYDTLTTKAYMTTGLTDTLAADLGFYFSNQGDGFGKNLSFGVDNNRTKSWAIRSKILWEPTDSFKVRLSGDYSKARTSVGDFVLPKGVLAIDGNPTSGSFDTRSNVIGEARPEQFGFSGRVDYDFGSVTLTSITAYRASKSTNDFDSDATDLDLVNASLPNKQHNWTQELQITSSNGSPVQWVVGAFYYNNVVHQDYGRIGGLAFGAPDNYIEYNTTQRAQSYAGYGQATVEIISGLKATGGLRYTHEKQKYGGTIVTRLGGPPVESPVASEEQSFSKLTWRASLDYEFDSDVHGYISFNRGVKSGGFNLLSPGSPAFRPETLDAYEIGLKSQIFDRRLRLNLAAFHYDYKDIQVQVVEAGAAFQQNAAKARIKGFEAEIEALPIENLTLSGNFSILDGKFLKYQNAPFFTPSPLTPHPPTLDASGSDTNYTPGFSGSAGFEYRIPASIGQLALGSTLYYNEGFNFGPNFRQQSYYLLSASVTWTSVDEQFQVRAWGANLTNAFYLKNGAPSGVGNLSVRADPRTYGITATVKF